MPQHCQPWAEDGNIIVVSADDSKAFRVHRSILSNYSEVFRSMFAASYEGEELIDNCPVVHLQDQADDIEHVLCALYGRGYYPQRFRATSVPFAVVAAFTRLGKKYEIKELYEEARLCLLSDFPDDYAAWCSRSYTIKSSSKKTLSINVSNLLQEASLLQALPAALYACMTECSLQELYFGVQDERGPVSLLPNNRDICMSAWQPFQLLAGDTFSWLSPRSSPTECRSRGVYMAHRLAIVNDKFYPFPTCQPLEAFNPQWTKNMCQMCSENAVETHETEREEAWERLPILFGLPEWSELKNEGI